MRKPPRPLIPAGAREKATATGSEFWLHGQLVGLSSSDDAGLVMATGLFRGKPDGYRVEYNDGRVSYAEPFVNGQLHGWAKQFATSGALIIACPFKRGTGTDYWCDEEGNLREEHPLVAGKPSGAQRWWANDQTIYEETHWFAGKWHGVKRSWVGGVLDRGFPQFFIRGNRMSKRAYLAAARRDSTLSPYSSADDSPKRRMPAAFLKLSRLARRSTSGSRASAR